MFESTDIDFDRGAEVNPRRGDIALRKPRVEVCRDQRRPGAVDSVPAVPRPLRLAKVIA
jgi:hypothetical protein